MHAALAVQFMKNVANHGHCQKVIHVHVHDCIQVMYMQLLD